MKKENKTEECCNKEMVFKRHHKDCHCGSSNVIYGLGIIGALFYFLGNATSFGMVMIGIGKSIFWPAILMFKLLTYLGL